MKRNVACNERKSITNTEKEETSPAALDQDPKKHACHIKTTPIRYIIAHSLNIQFEYIKSQRILQYYTENLSQEENNCISLISHQQPLQ